jgi:sensor histidine kinase YesM
LNENFDLLFENGNFDALPEDVFSSTVAFIKNGEAASGGVKGYFAAFQPSEVFGLWYVSLIPERSAYRGLIIILNSLVLAAVVSLVISFALAWYFTKRNFNELYSIIRIFEQAEQGQEIPSPRGKKNNAYFYILERVVNVFITQSYMKEQLALRKFELLSAQLAALQYQINPHFLFNTLQSIDLEIRRRKRGENKASRMITQLAGLLRYSLGDPVKLVPIGEEMQMAKDYLAIQKYRNKAPFEVIWDYRDTVLSWKILRLLLQPLLENVLVHGVREDEKVTLIKVSIKKRGEQIYFRVSDNGRGIDSARIREIRDSLVSSGEYIPGHIGLANINRRLCLQYGYSGSALTLKSRSGRGTAVSFFVHSE